MVQLSYTNEKDIGLPGMLADSGSSDVVSKVNPDAAIPFGAAVCAGSDADRDVKLPTSAAEVAACLGISIASQALESSSSGDPQYPVKSAVPVARKARITCKVTESVTPSSKVYVRFGNGVADGNIVQKGSFGKSPDGTAQVTTLTPTAVNDEHYTLEIVVPDRDFRKTYNYVADANATATEIAAGLKALVNADTATHGITATGTTTLILTSGLAGESFDASGPNLAAAVSPAPGASAALWRNAKFLSSAAAGSLAIVEINLP